MIENLIQELAFSLEKFGTGAYLLVSLGVLFETVVVLGQFIPGSLFLVLVGFLCYMGVFDFSAMMTSVILAHLAGEFINYGIGRYKGRSLFHEDSRFFKPRLLEMAESRFENSGAKLLITGQFLGFLRPFISLAAGAAHYSLLRFLFAMIIACSLWAIVPLGIGFFFGASWQQAVGYMRDFSLVLVVGIPVAFFSGWCIKQLLQLSGSLYKFLERLNRSIHESVWYSRLSLRHPKTFGFLEGRLSLSKDWGLAATFGFSCALFFFCLCMAILWDVHTRDNWYTFDLSMVNLLAELRTRGADNFFLIVTHLGAAPVISTVVVLAAGACYFSRQHKSMFVIVGSVVFSTLGAELLEFVFRRNRPDLALHLVEAHGFSFPSTHATVAFALFGSLYYWLWNHPGVLRVRASLAFLLLLAAFLVGFSRIYLGVHYPSDVVSGFCLGFAGVLTCGTIAANWKRLADVQSRADLKAAAILVVYVLGAWGYAVMHPIALNHKGVAQTKVTRVSSLEPILSFVPRAARTLFGFSYVPVTFMTIGNPDNIIDQLKSRKWEQVRPADFFTRGVADPVFPAFISGKPAAYTFQQEAKNGRRIIRFWKTSAIIGKESLWLGNVVFQKRERKWRTVDVYHQSPDIDYAVEQLAIELSMTSSTSKISDFRSRGLYHWRNTFFTHGEILCIQFK